MKTDFWYPFYPSKFKSATRHLTAEQDGIYRRLIDEYMETREPLPDNDIALARIAGVNDIKWLDAARILRAYFTHKNGMLYHDFCDQMLDIQDKKSKMRSAAAEKAAKKRWSGIQLDQDVTCVSHAERNAVAMRQNATETETDIKKVKEKNIKKEKTEIPCDRFQEFWTIFPKQRKGNQAKAYSAYRQAILRDTEENILSGLNAYRLSDEVMGGFAKGAAAWLNDDRWLNDYTFQPTKGKTNGKYTADDALRDALAAIDAKHGKDETGGALCPPVLCSDEHLRTEARGFEHEDAANGGGFVKISVAGHLRSFRDMEAEPEYYPDQFGYD